MAWQLVNTALTINSAGVSIPLSTLPTLVPSVVIQADLNNTGNIFVGDSGVDALSDPTKGIKLSASDNVSIREPASGLSFIDLSTIFVDAALNADVAQVTFLKEI